MVPVENPAVSWYIMVVCPIVSHEQVQTYIHHSRVIQKEVAVH